MTVLYISIQILLPKSSRFKTMRFAVTHLNCYKQMKRQLFCLQCLIYDTVLTVKVNYMLHLITMLTGRGTLFITDKLNTGILGTEKKMLSLSASQLSCKELKFDSTFQTKPTTQFTQNVQS